MLADALAELATMTRSGPDMDGALCAQSDPDLWFPEAGHPEQAREAKQICRQCPVRAECLEYALEAEENPYGIWGATTERERRAMRRLPLAA